MTGPVVAQMIIALCHHERFTEGCETCKIRREEAVAHSLRIINECIAALDGDGK